MNLEQIKQKHEELNFQSNQKNINFIQRSYRKVIAKIINEFLPNNNISILDVGCGDAFLTNLIKSKNKVGIEPNSFLYNKSIRNYKDIKFINKKIESYKGRHDYLILSDTLSYVFDVQKILVDIKKNLKINGRLIITIYNPFFKIIIDFIQLLNFLPKNNKINWLTARDIENLLYLSDWEIIKNQKRIIFPFYIPIISSFLNSFFHTFLPFFCLKTIFVCKSNNVTPRFNNSSLSLIIPARNEEGNIDNILKRIPKFNFRVEYIFIEGNSTDNTWGELVNIVKKYPKLDIRIFKQPGIGKYDAVKYGISQSKSTYFLILDSDMTVPPEEIVKFYEVLNSGKADMVNGVRLVYPLEKDSMQYLNFCANKFFSFAFSWVFNQNIGDTLCGTKGMALRNYKAINLNRKNFDLKDPFGDFELIHGASFLNLKIVDIPVRYQRRYYGNTNISRFKHGLVLFRILIRLVFKNKII